MAQIPYMNWMGNQPSGSAYDVYQYYLGGGSPGGTSTPTSGGGGGITSLPWYQQTGGGGGGDFKGGGRYGNLDLSKSKTFNKDVWGEFGPDKGGWKTKDVQGFYNPTTGQYQTLAGKNINHLGLTVPSISGMLFDKSFGKGPQIGDIKGTFTEGWDEGLENIKEGSEEWFDAIKTKVGWGKKKAKKALEQKKHIAAIELKEKQKEERKRQEAAKKTAPQHHGDISQGGGHQAPNIRSISEEGPGVTASSGMHGGKHYAEGGMVNDPEYRGWKKMYEANPEIGSMHEKHPTFIKFYKKYERDRKKFGGLAGLLYG